MLNVREAVVKALTKIEKDEGYSNLALNAFLQAHSFSREDAAFASRLIYGVIERKITLDYYIEKSSSRSFNNISLFLLNNLRVAIYQICFMDKVPESAAVNEAVNITKRSKDKFAAGFVNAVLRAFLRQIPELPSGDTDYALSIRYSCAKWYIHELKQYIGKEKVEPFLADSLQPPPTYIRVNTLKTTAEKLKQELNDIKVSETSLDDALEIKAKGSITKTPSFKNGLFHIQDLASQIAIASLGIKENDAVLDVCAAPGGKSCTAAQYACGGSVVSCDLYPSRVELINDNLIRLGIENAKAIVNDALKVNDSIGLFDKIICDVPCSGFGVIRRKPEIKYKTLDDLTNLPQVQYNILKISAKYLKVGGRLLYSTCTLRAAENEDVVAEFLKDNDNYYLAESGYNTLLPQTDGSDGFFFAVICRK